MTPDFLITYKSSFCSSIIYKKILSSRCQTLLIAGHYLFSPSSVSLNFWHCSSSFFPGNCFCELKNTKPQMWLFILSMSWFFFSPLALRYSCLKILPKPRLLLPCCDCLTVHPIPSTTTLRLTLPKHLPSEFQLYISPFSVNSFHQKSYGLCFMPLYHQVDLSRNRYF